MIKNNMFRSQTRDISEKFAITNTQQFSSGVM